jgi:hypothetical protein
MLFTVSTNVIVVKSFRICDISALLSTPAKRANYYTLPEVREKTNPNCNLEQVGLFDACGAILIIRCMICVGRKKLYLCLTMPTVFNDEKTMRRRSIHENVRLM